MSSIPPETIPVEVEKLHCDGGPGAEGHPRVYLAISKAGSVDCPYCGRHFVLVEAVGGKRASAH